MRQLNQEVFRRPAATALARPTLCAPRIGLLGMILVLLLGSSTGLAEPADATDAAIPDVVVLLTDAMTLSVDRSAAAEWPKGADPADDRLHGRGDPPRATLQELVFVRSLDASLRKPQTTDEILAVAVADRMNPTPEPLNPFRKRSRDLFRAERPVSIGNADMLLRLRLRAKASKAVSVELRF